MDLYLAGLAVTSDIQLTDGLGNRLNVDSLSYQVVDETGAIIIALAAVPDFVSGSASVQIVVPADSNQLAVGVIRSLRRITLLCLVGANTVTVELPYAIQTNEVLVTGVNSFQTYDQALLTSMDIPNLIGWDAALYKDRTAALVEARVRLCQLNYSLLSASAWAQDSLNYIPDGTRIVPFPNVFGYTGDISWLTVESFNSLPAYFLEALRKAQIAEANVILGGDNAGDKRRDGLVKDKVGESEQTYRAGKGIDLQVSRPALRYLSRFITFNLKLTRV